MWVLSVRILVGDVRDRLAELPDASVHMVMTSPPYWGLREYKGERGMIGLEATFEEHIAVLVEVFREVWRVLRDDGTLWLNYGDAYYGGGRAGYTGGNGATINGGNRGSISGKGRPVPGLKVGDLMLMPFEVAKALRTEGWYLESEIIYHKLNPMPESVRKRPTQAHEKVWLFAKSGKPLYWQHRAFGATRRKPAPDYRWFDKVTREEFETDPGDKERYSRVNLWRGCDYFYDDVAVLEEVTGGSHPRRKDGRRDMAKGADPNDRRRGYDPRPPAWKALPSEGLRNRGERMGREPGWRARTEDPYHAQYDSGHKGLDSTPRGKRNLRNVWTMSTGAGFGEAHFATFPPELCEIPVKAGSSEHGVCSSCGAPWVRLDGEPLAADGRRSGNLERKYRGEYGGVSGSLAHQGFAFPYEPKVRTTVGWAPTCECDAVVVPATVLDPFAGSGTLGLVADRLHRNAILIEISPEYADMAERRIGRETPLFTEVSVHP